ncbi:hypothetical protein OAT18_02980 [Tenacibaculum sp.]|nr:hypothetical protein [Tenacibaculum sp.]
MKKQQNIMSETKEQYKAHWSSELLTLLGIWLFEKGEIGHALLCITGPQWGYKTAIQLKITWDDVYDFEDHHVKTRLFSDAQEDDINDRYITGLANNYIELAYDKVDVNYVEDSICMNYKTGKPLSTSTLNRELQKFSKQFLKEIEEKTGKEFHLKPLKSNAFQVAFALKLLAKYSYSKKAFVSISKFMGHRTLKDTIKLLEVEPFDTIVYDFQGFSESSNLNIELLESTDKLKNFMKETMFDHWVALKDSFSPLS